MGLVLVSVLFQSTHFLLPNLISKLIDQILEHQHRTNWNVAPKIPLCSSNCALLLRIADSFLTIKQQHNTGNGSAFLLNNADSFAKRGASGDDVVNDQNSFAFKRCTDDVATFAVVFGFFAVEGVADVVPCLCAGESVPGSELIDDTDAFGDSFVGGTIIVSRLARISF